MEDKLCPENDGAYRMEMAAIHRDSLDQQLHRARAEIDQLRAELAESRASEHGLFGRLETRMQDEAALKADLEAERELADRLAETVRAADYVIKSARPDSGWLVAYKDGIAAANTRRNK